ncbi:cold-shock protein [Colwellia sp. 75C3]|uniref:cold shock domain-containing protein n=1 Tax=Colwellia sp. 75C3 TaxID=888425 RepID=UPI000C3343B1|nr:cold shock domain-containing protein [Colwellia sp. 75C3]PKG82774.1 cold-shock protein [Colwellia sp. 75C3]
MQGKIVRWNDDRGFGFISAKNNKSDVFAHISQFKKGYRSPRVGDSVNFQVTMEKGKTSAKLISFIDVQPIPKLILPFAPQILISILILIPSCITYIYLNKPIQPEVYNEMGFTCGGKNYCSQMISCNEAKFYLANCPNVEIDGDGDGIPCERQLCNSW